MKLYLTQSALGRVILHMGCLLRAVGGVFIGLASDANWLKRKSDIFRLNVSVLFGFIKIYDKKLYDRKKARLQGFPVAGCAARVKDLLARITLNQKAAQMMCVWQEMASKLVDGNGNFEQN